MTGADVQRGTHGENNVVCFQMPCFYHTFTPQKDWLGIAIDRMRHILAHIVQIAVKFPPEYRTSGKEILRPLLARIEYAVGLHKSRAADQRVLRVFHRGGKLVVRGERACEQYVMRSGFFPQHFCQRLQASRFGAVERDAFREPEFAEASGDFSPDALRAQKIHQAGDAFHYQPRIKSRDEIQPAAVFKAERAHRERLRVLFAASCGVGFSGDRHLFIGKGLSEAASDRSGIKRASAVFLNALRKPTATLMTSLQLPMRNTSSPPE